MKQILTTSALLLSVLFIAGFANHAPVKKMGYQYTGPVSDTSIKHTDSLPFAIVKRTTLFDYSELSPLFRAFPGTDSLRAYNIQWITNNSSLAFTNFRLRTLLAGMIDWIDSARLGLGGQPGVDSIAQVNDSTFRYRKNGTFHNIQIRGGVDQNNLTTGTSFNTGTGILTTTRSGLSSLTVDIDGRYVNTILRRSDSVFYTKDGVETFAFKDSTGSTGVWGSITGTLSAQTDLQAALDAKVPTSRTITINGTTHDLSANRTWNVGTVTQGQLDDTAAAIRADMGGGGATDITITHAATTATVNSSTGTDGTINYAKNTLAGVVSPRNSDIGHLPEIKSYMPAKGLQASASATNYPYTLIDSNRSKFVSSGGDRGGWLTNNLTGDSVQVRAPFWVVFGDSQAEGHGPGSTGRHGRLDANGTSVFDPAYPDSTGQLSYHLRFLTNMRWYNHGIGGQNTTQSLRRFYRDVVGRAGNYSNADSRGNQTLWYKPQGVVIIIGVNDVQQGVALETIKRNMELMASICQTEGIQCVMLNIPGDEIFDTVTARKVESLNVWLAGGVMDQYGATVVDYNSWWKDPTYNDNYHGSSLIADDIHPSRVGYDSLANFIFRSAHLPVLKRAIFINELDPGGFTGYSRPTGFTIGNAPGYTPTAYTIANAIDSVTITSPVWDSVWIKTTATTNVTGTTFSGWGTIYWYTENNIDTLRVTKRTLYSNGSQKSQTTVSKVTIIPPSYASTEPVLDIPLADITTNTVGLQVYTDGGLARMVLNGLTTSAAINNGVLSVYGVIGSNSNILADGSSSRLGQYQFLTNGSASATGYGQSTGGAAYSSNYQTTPVGGKAQFLLNYWSGNGTTTLGAVASSVTSILDIPIGFGNAANTDQKGYGINLRYAINQTAAQTGIQFTDVRLDVAETSLTGSIHRSFNVLRGNSYFNTVGGNFGIGVDSNTTIGAKLHVNGSFRVDLGSDATGDIYYRNATPTITRLGIGSSGDVLTVSGGVPVWSAPAASTNIYNTNGTLTGNRTLTGSSNSLTFTGMSAMNFYTSDFTFAKNDGTYPYLGRVVALTGNTWGLGFQKGGNYSPTIIIDTNNNVHIGGSIGTTLPLYATGLSLNASQGFQSSAGNFYKVSNITNNTTINLSYYFITVDATGGNVTITLPAASTAFGGSVGITYVFKRLDNSGNTITIQRAGSDTIDGGTNFTLTTQYETKNLICASSSTWLIF